MINMQKLYQLFMRKIGGERIEEKVQYKHGSTEGRELACKHGDYILN